MDKRFWVCGIVMFLAAMLLSGVVHAVLLKPDYLALGPMYRSDADGQAHFPWMLLAHALIGFAMTWIYRQGFVAGKSNISQGMRFGLAMALFSTIPGYLIYYAVQPLPAMLVIKQIVFSTISMLLLGVVLAYLQPRRVVL